MKWAVIVIRTLLAAAFIMAGSTYFLKFIDEPPPANATILAWMTIMASSHYLDVIKALEVIGGLLLITGRLAPLGMTILMPIIVNILCFELLIAKAPGIGVVLTLFGSFVIYGYWPYFRAVFTTNAKIGG